jgi:hypothetical protein
MNDAPPLSLYDFTALDRFPQSRAYRDLPPRAREGVREPEPALRDPFTERHLHCVWYDDRLRPKPLTTLRGESIDIHHPGRWNFEAGPDFLDAEWTVGGRRITGDVEIHIRPMDWKHHNHHNDPRYRNVRLHVTYEPGSLPPGLLPPACEETSLQALLEKRSHFFFDSIDTSAYPWEIDGSLHALRLHCETMDDEHRGALLDAAGQERLRRKTLRMARAIQAVGPEQALYQALLRALGYKHNADVCEELARRIPLHELRREAAGDPETAYALLLGVSGLLPHEEEARGLPPWADLRRLWNLWWRHQQTFSERQLTRDVWRLDGSRPGNHPYRRLRAAAELFASPPFPEDRLRALADESPKTWLRRCRQTLLVREPGDGDRLIGPQRAAAILVNALVPWRAVMEPGEVPMDLLCALPGEPANALARNAAHALFGPDHHPRIWRNTLRKQGLLQFHEDYGI